MTAVDEAHDALADAIFDGDQAGIESAARALLKVAPTDDTAYMAIFSAGEAYLGRLAPEPVGADDFVSFVADAMLLWHKKGGRKGKSEEDKARARVFRLERARASAILGLVAQRPRLVRLAAEHTEHVLTRVQAEGVGDDEMTRVALGRFLCEGAVVAALTGSRDTAVTWATAAADLVYVSDEEREQSGCTIVQQLVAESSPSAHLALLPPGHFAHRASST
mmetsp:Transcript_8920/g.28473  ORF Transcript_8920/g.28473 Transcript_8920/m.28473 type:complete len:221 (+) Transcript_8920:75-737(+)